MVEALLPPELARIVYEYMWFHGEVTSTYSYTPNLTLTHSDYTLILHGKGVDVLGTRNVPFTMVRSMYDHACFIDRSLILAESGNLFIMEYAVIKPLRSPSACRIVGLTSTHDRHLVVTRANGEVEIWDLHTRTIIHRVGFYQLLSRPFAIDNRIGFVCGTTIIIWDYTPLISDGVIRIEMHSGITALFCSNNVVIVGLVNGDVCRILDGAITATFSGHTNVILAVCLLEDGYIASGSLDRTVRIWRPDTTCHRVLPYFARTLAPLRHNQLAIGTMSHTLHILV